MPDLWTRSRAAPAPPRLRSAIAWLSGSALLVRLIGVVTGVITARALAPEGRGELAVLTVIALFWGVVVSAGLDLWAARVIAQRADAEAVLQLTRRHQLLTAGLTLVVALAFVRLSDLPPRAVFAAGLLGWATASSMLKLGLLQGSNRMAAYAVSSLSASVAYGVGVVVLAAREEATVTAFLAVAAVSRLVTAVWPVRDRRRASNVASAGGDHVSYRSALRFGAPWMLGGVVTFALYRLDVALVALWRSTEEAGLYVVALSVAELLWILPNSAAQAVVPRASQVSPAVDTARVCRVVVAGMCISGAVAVVGGWIAVPIIFGQEFGDAVNALPGLCAASVAIGVWKLLAYDLVARGDATTRYRSGLIGVVAMVVADALLVPTFGIVGASIGSLAAYVTAAGIAVRIWTRRCGDSVSNLLVPRSGDVGQLRRWQMSPTPQWTVTEDQT